MEESATWEETAGPADIAKKNDSPEGEPSLRVNATDRRNPGDAFRKGALDKYY